MKPGTRQIMAQWQVLPLIMCYDAALIQPESGKSSIAKRKSFTPTIKAPAARVSETGVVLPERPRHRDM